MEKKRKISIAAVAIILIAIIVFAVTRFMGVGADGIDNKPEQIVKGNSNILVAYFSWSGHGQQIARWISDETVCRRKKCNACADFTCLDECQKAIYRADSGNKKT